MQADLEAKLERIRSHTKLQNQQETRVVLNAVEDTLRDQNSEFTPTAYFAALLSLLDQFLSASKGLVNKDVATAVVYLLDLVTPHVPKPVLRSKFSHILKKLGTALTSTDSDAPLLRPSIGCLESLLIVQDAEAWKLPAEQISPRRAMAGLLNIAVDHRPKVRRRACEAVTQVLQNPPPSPSLDHPAADMCAETALFSLKEAVEASKKTSKKHKEQDQSGPSLMHALQLVKTIATASGGWPSRKMDSLCDALLTIAKSSNEYLTMAAFEVFEVMFAGMADDVSSSKLPRLLEILDELQPSANDTQLLPPWIAVISRGYDIASQVDAEDTFQRLPEPFQKVANFLSSSSENIRVSAAECLISFLINCVPDTVIIDPSIYDEKVLEKLSKIVTDLLSVKYQTAWMQVFQVLGATFDTFRWHSSPSLSSALKAVGQLRGTDSFNGKKEADAVIAKAVTAMGAENALDILPLNLAVKTDEPGRAWMLPILRDSVRNTSLDHFRKVLVPLSEKMFQKVMDNGNNEKSMEIKIYETVVQQIWSCLPGYCVLPLDLRSAFDQTFAELVANLLYQQVELRVSLCRALQNLVESNKALIALENEDSSIAMSRISKADAQKNLEHLAGFSSNLLAVLFNVYTQTLPVYRGPILQCIDAYLSVTPEEERMETFTKVVTSLEAALAEKKSKPNGAEKNTKHKDNQMPPMSQTLMDLVITIAIYLPRQSLAQLFGIATVLLQKDDPNLQKKAYKLIPRLAESEMGRIALQERSDELQALLLGSAEKTTAAARRDRLAAISRIVTALPDSDLTFIPAILPEVVICTKETNERARNMAFDLLVQMGERMKSGGTIIQKKVPNMSSDASDVAASLEEYLTMVSAGLAGTVPHSVSATITALTRILYHFRSHLPPTTTSDLVETMDIFLKSPNREIIRSVLGFTKVCIISLDRQMMETRLPTLIPGLLKFGHEHKAHLQAKIKHIFERMIRRFGFEIVEKYTPADDHKLISNIRKTKERAKRKAREDGGEEDGATEDVKRKGKFENEYDQAVYGSGDEASDASGSDVSDDEVLGRSKQHKTKKGGDTFIVDDDEDPLDLLDRKALGRISSTRPQKTKTAPEKKRKANIDLDGKLVIGDDGPGGGADDAEMLDLEKDGEIGLEDGINAYVQAIKGRDSAKRGRGGKLKFSNRKNKDDVDDGDEMEVDAEDVVKAVKRAQQSSVRGNDRPRGGMSAGRGGGMKNARMNRKGLGAERTRGGRVDKGSSRGGGRGRSFKR
ncbi:NUC173-domain-containing protein [Venturia nashicola]|uniref:NUC173-domain-containing protein n=1 Tax=Venturia nashicola TaxID=86259 RepID=A0A4Z1P8A8_9PEZI|nr:NUC173-domain-containing protein [Venturia nashicola]TLD36663.1 NUC173-domain-containing protein [Venturia nashicola]